MAGSLSGYLLAAPNERPIARRALEEGASRSSKAPHLAFKQPYQNLKFWEEYTFSSDRSFADDPVIGNQRLPFKYPVYCARSGSKLIILSEKRRLTDYIIESVLNDIIFPNLRHVSFQIERMISAFQEVDSEYRLTSLHGRYSGPERSLRTIVLYGSEVANSALFREQRHLFNFYRCGVAERSLDDPFMLNDDSEIARLGNNGSITVQSFSRKRATELNKIVNQLIQNKWVDDWVVPWEDSHNDLDEGS
jgi:hypothetical protein